MTCCARKKEEVRKSIRESFFCGGKTIVNLTLTQNGIEKYKYLYFLVAYCSSRGFWLFMGLLTHDGEYQDQILVPMSNELNTLIT